MLVADFLARYRRNTVKTRHSDLFCRAKQKLEELKSWKEKLGMVPEEEEEEGDCSKKQSYLDEWNVD